jgi:cholesterol oxidase
MFAPLCNHDQLNNDTHTAIIEMFKNANMQTYKQLTQMVRANKLTDADGNDVYMPHFDKLKMPITFIHGEKNKLFTPKSTEETYNRLCNVNGKNLYKRHIIKNYGHNDCMYGKNAAVDVFPKVLDHFEQFYK